MAGKFLKSPLLVEGSCVIIDAIEDHCNECERTASLVAVTERCCKEDTPESSPLLIAADGQPRENRHRQQAARQAFGEVGRQVTEIHRNTVNVDATACYTRLVLSEWGLTWRWPADKVAFACFCGGRFIL